jgi:hypothetical protein
VVSDRGEPGEGFVSVVSSAERIHVGSRRGAVGCWLVINVAAVGGHGAGGEAI